LIRFSSFALVQIDQLTAHYETKGRPEAARNLERALERGVALIAAGPRHPRLYPATYRQLARPGRAWIKVPPYWIAYDMADPPLIVAVFWEGADLASRYRELP